ncbi:MAG: hypothetical protein CR997_13080 [Acidobacteria bacterium]|nr:MAG: hypothetical protein CR997_13080 [Acidobacteriota bacterium]
MKNNKIHQPTIEKWVEHYNSAGLPVNEKRINRLMSYIRLRREAAEEELPLDNTEASTRVDELLKKSNV